MKKCFLSLVLSVLIFSTNIANSQYTVSKQKTMIESWYLTLGLGYSVISYPSWLQNGVDELVKISGTSHLPLNINLGVYWPSSNDKNLFGVCITGDGDRFENGNNSMQINTYLIGGSMIHHLSSYIGDAFYVRGDAGIAYAAIVEDFGSGASSDIGFGLRIGLGYAIPVSMETRIQIDAGYTYRNIESDDYGSFSIGAALLL